MCLQEFENWEKSQWLLGLTYCSCTCLYCIHYIVFAYTVYACMLEKYTIYSSLVCLENGLSVFSKIKPRYDPTGLVHFRNNIQPFICVSMSLFSLSSRIRPEKLDDSGKVSKIWLMCKTKRFLCKHLGD